MEKAHALSNSHESIRKDLTTSLALEKIEVRSSIKEFLSDPIAHLTKLLYDPLFDLLMGKINPLKFEEMATSKLQLAFDSFFQQAYQSWIMLALMQLMVADEVYAVPSQINQYANECDSTITDSGGLPKQMVPDAAQTRMFSLDSETFVSFLFPKVIVHSKLLNLFVSLVPDFRNVQFRLMYLNKNVEWLTLSALFPKIGPGKIWPDLGIYLAKETYDLVTVADNLYIARPDIIMHIEQEKDLREPGNPDMLKNRNEVFTPRLGSFVICPEIIPEASLEIFRQQLEPVLAQVKHGDTPLTTQSAHDSENISGEVTPNAAPQRNIEILCVGYDPAKLEPVANAILRSKRYAELVPNPGSGTGEASV